MINSKTIPQHIVEAMTKEDRKAMGVKTIAERAEHSEAVTEAQIQREVEAYLSLCGFERRTPDDIKRAKPRTGWQIHLHKTKRNPILLDLVLLHNCGAYLELELKTPDGTLSPEQACLVEYGAPVAYSSTSAIAIINRWLNDCAGVNEAINKTKGR